MANLLLDGISTFLEGAVVRVLHTYLVGMNTFRDDSLTARVWHLSYRWELKPKIESGDMVLTLKVSSSLDNVLFELRYSPLIISFNSGNFFVGRTFFLSIFLVPTFFWNDLLC